MDEITRLEGVGYFFDHAEEAGIIISENTDFCAIHTSLTWVLFKNGILEHIRYRYMVGTFTFIKTTIMKNGLYNHIFKVDY